MFLQPGSYSDDENLTEESGYVPGRPGAQKSLLAGSTDKDTPEYYDKILLVWWPGVSRSDAKMPYPIVDRIEPKSDWTGYHNWSCFDMRLTGDASSHAVLHNIDPKRKVSFKFISDSIPDVRTVFFIRGKRYIFEKISATFTESGMSQLLKGDFYQIID